MTAPTAPVAGGSRPDRAAAQARRLLWLFPAWLRPTRGEEAIGLVLDLLPPGARRLPLRSRMDLVRAGLHARLTRRVPVLLWLRVLVAGRSVRTGSVPTVWRPWLTTRLGSPRWRWRFVAERSALAALLAVGSGLLDDGPVLPDLPLMAAAAAGVVALISYRPEVADAWRDRVLARNGLGGDLEPLPGTEPDAEQVVVGFAQRLPNLAVAALVGAFLPIPAVGALWSVLQALDVASGAPTGTHLPVAAFAWVGGILAVAGSGLRRAASTPPGGAGPVAPARALPSLAAAFTSFLVTSRLAVDRSPAWSQVGLPTVVTLATVALLVAVLRRQRIVGHRLGVWDVWLVLRPAPILAPAGRRPPPEPPRPAVG